MSFPIDVLTDVGEFLGTDALVPFGRTSKNMHKHTHTILKSREKPRYLFYSNPESLLNGDEGYNRRGAMIHSVDPIDGSTHYVANIDCRNGPVNHDVVPAPCNKWIYAVTDNGNFNCYCSFTGQFVWTANVGKPRGQMIIDSDGRYIILVTTSFLISVKSACLCCIDTCCRSVTWKTSVGEDDMCLSEYYTSTPRFSIDEKSVFFFTGLYHLCQVNLDDGSIIWYSDDTYRRYESDGFCVHNDYIIFVHDDFPPDAWDVPQKGIVCISATTKQTVWDSIRIHGKFVIDTEKSILFVADDNLVAVDVHTGRSMGWYSFNYSFASYTPIIWKDSIIICEYAAGGLHKISRDVDSSTWNHGSVDATTVEPELDSTSWYYELENGNLVISSPVLDDGNGRVIFGTSGNKIYSLDLDSGVPVWTTSITDTLMWQTPVIC